MYNSFCRQISGIVFTAFLSVPLFAAESGANTPGPSDASAPLQDTGSSALSDGRSSSGSTVGIESRWFNLTTAFVGTRMRSVDASNGSGGSTEQQHKEKFEGYLRLDKEGRYTIHTSVSSGYYFTRSYAETGWGTPWYQERGYNLFVRQLYMQAEPIDGIQFQYGSLPILRGSVSENISYDEDGYIAGERLSIKRPRQLFFDNIAVTYAYIGDYYKPNMFNRLDRFSQSNYHQFLISKKVNDGVSLSADLTHHGWSETVRVGAIIDARRTKIFDTLRLGVYRRYSDNSGTGFETTAERHIGRRLKLAGGWVSVDKGTMDLVEKTDLVYQRPASMTLGYAPGGSLNADRFARGDSPYGSASFQLNPMLKLTAFGTTDIDQKTYVIKNSQIMLLGLDCDLIPALRKIGIR